MTLIALAVAALAAGTPPVTDPVLTEMVALYDDLCLKAFPDDGAIDRAVAARSPTVLSPDQVRIYLHDDPGRGWWIDDANGRFVITIEAPPYHACSVRRLTDSGFTDMTAYSTRLASYSASHPGYTQMAPMDMDIGDIHSHATGVQRALTNGGSDTLFMFENRPATVSKSKTGVEIRFVRQLASPEAH